MYGFLVMFQNHETDNSEFIKLIIIEGVAWCGPVPTLSYIRASDGCRSLRIFSSKILVNHTKRVLNETFAPYKQLTSIVVAGPRINNNKKNYQRFNR